MPETRLVPLNASQLTTAVGCCLPPAASEYQIQYPPKLSGFSYASRQGFDRQHFGLPAMLGGKILSIVPWSRILSDSEIVVAINTDPDAEKAAWVTIDAGLHKEGESLTCIYSSDAKQIGKTAVVEARNGLAVRLTAPAAGVVVFK